MNAAFQITRAFIFLLLASFSLTTMAVTVSSESGGASLSGIWDFPGCSEPDSEDPPDERFDQREQLIFNGTTVEDKLFLYSSTTGICNDLLTTESESFSFSVTGAPESPGWLGDDPDPVSPPACQDPDAAECQDNELPGLLDSSPYVTELAILIPGDPDAEDPEDREDRIETGLWYIDDTGPLWYLYRDAGDDGVPSEFMSIFEPLINSDPDVSVIPVPAGIWLFGTALIGFVGYNRRRKLA